MISRELIAASTRPMVLAVLSKEASYGYAIIQRVRELSGGELVWSEGMLYPVLHRMEEDKLIIGEWKKSDNGRARKYYRLSQTGHRSLVIEQKQWVAVNHTLETLWGMKPCLT